MVLKLSKYLYGIWAARSLSMGNIWTYWPVVGGAGEPRAGQDQLSSMQSEWDEATGRERVARGPPSHLSQKRATVFISTDMIKIIY